jgi:hypothetical protein
MRYYAPLKILLGEKGAEDRTISFLNAALRFKTDGERIERIQFLDRSIFSIDIRSIHFDVKIQGLCSTYAGHTFLVEIQRLRIPSRINHWKSYGARELSAIGEHLHNLRARSLQDIDVNQKNLYSDLTPVKVIVILDFDCPQLQKELQNSTDFVVDWDIREKKSHDVSWTFLVLPRFSAVLSASGNSLDFTGKNLEAWLFLMTREDFETVWVTKELVANDAAVAQGFYRLSNLNSNEIDSLLDERIAFDSLSQIRQEHYDQGFAKGQKEGLIKGKKTKSLLIANELKLLGLSAEEISDIIGATTDEIMST